MTATRTEHLLETSPSGEFCRIADALAALAGGAAMARADGRIVLANARLCDWLGRAPSALCGQRLTEFCADAREREQAQAALERPGASQEFELNLQRPDGRAMTLLVAVGPLVNSETGVNYRFITMLDISKHKQSAADREEYYQDIAKLSDTVLEQALELKRYSERLEEKVRERTRELDEANHSAITMLAVASEAKDADTGAHVLRIQRLAEALAKQLGMSASDAERIGYSAILHDVGKMQVPDAILKKPGSLTTEERDEIELHTIVGERILSSMPFFEIARRIARSHHENFDGSGYPDGIAGENIPIAARIVRLVDVYDGLTSKRSYKEAWTRAAALDYIRSHSGTFFDPQLVGAFEALCADGVVDRLIGPAANTIA